MSVAAVAALSACSSASRDHEGIPQRSSAAVVKCAEELKGPDETRPGACTSAWEYVRECHAELAATECGQSAQGFEKLEVKKAVTCEAPRFGLRRTDDIPVIREGLSRYQTEWGDTTCQEWSEEHLEALRREKRLDARMPEYQAMRIKDRRSFRTDPQYGIIRCEYVVEKVPTWNSGADEDPCGTTTSWEDDPSRPIQNKCRSVQHPLVAAAECDARPERSAPRLTRSELLASMPKLAEALASSTPGIPPPEPRCLSCDDVPILRADGTADPAAVVRRYQCLTANLARYVRTSNVAPPTDAEEGWVIAVDIVRGLKLLVEMYGEFLDASERDTVASLYLRTPAPRCSPTPDPTVASCSTRIGGGAGGPALVTAYAKYLACEALRDHGSGAMIMNETKACVAAAAAVRAAKSDPSVADCSAVPADFEQQLLLAGLGRGVPKVPVAGEPAFDAKIEALQADIRLRLAAIDAWYTAAAAAVDGAVTQPTVTPEQAAKLRGTLAAETGAVLGAFWAPLLDVSPASAAAGRSSIERTASVVERTVLAAAYPQGSSDAPLTHAPLLFVTTDALQGLAQHLDAIGAVHDLGCRFLKEGCAAGTRESAASELWDALANLHDGPALTASLTRATHLTTEPWKQTLSAIASKHVALEAAARDALSLDPSALTATALVQPPAGQVRHAAAGISFARFVNDARRRRASYVGTGLLALSGEGEIADALTQDKRALAINHFEGTKNDLDNLRGEYARNEIGDLNALAAQVQTDGAKAVIIGKLSALGIRFDKLTDEIAALRTLDGAEEARFGNFMTSLEKMIDEEVARAEFSIQRDPPRSFSLSARDARFRISDGVPTLAGIKVAEPTASFSVQAGEIVNLHVSGAWSPTCALRGLTMPDNKVLDQATLAAVTTGPEGFAMTTTAQGSTVRAQQTTDTTSISWSQSNVSKACGAVSFMPNAWGMAAGANGDSCDVSTRGISQTLAFSQTDGTGEEHRVTAAFASGIRAPNTPFPSAPAGSLIMVATKLGRPNLTDADLLDVRVVRAPFTSIVLAADADVTFVVNDSADCGTTASDAPLTVQRTSLVPLGASLKALAGPMRAAMDYVTSKRDTLIAQGQLLPSTSAQLQLEAQTILARGCRCDLAQYPRFVQQFFATWIAKEIARTERQVTIAAKEYERRLVITEAQEVRGEVEANEKLGRIQAVVASLAIRSVDPRQLQGKIREVAETAVTFVRPALRLRLPAALALINADTTIQAQANDLIDVAEAAGSASEIHLDAVAQAESNFVASLIATIRTAQRSAPPPTESIVAVRIPRYVDASPGDTSTTPCVRYPRISGAEEAAWKAIDCAKSRAIWSQVLDTTRTTASFDLEPNDLYVGTGSGSAGLLCNVSAPLILQMAIVVATDDDARNESLNLQHFASHLQLGDRMVFSMATGPETYRLVPDALGRGASADSQVRVLFSKSDFAVETFTTALGKPTVAAELAKQAGFSPFTTYTFDVAGLRARFATPEMTEAHELVLVFNIEPYPATGGNVKGVPICSAALP